MRIGVPREIKVLENRVGLTPAAVRELVAHGHDVVVEHNAGAIDVQAGQAIITHPREWVRYSTPDPEGAEYLAVCLPAFALNTVHRD